MIGENKRNLRNKSKGYNSKKVFVNVMGMVSTICNEPGK